MDVGKLNCYLSGIFDMASSASSWMGPSYAVVYLFENGDFETELKKRCRLSADMFCYSGLSFSEHIYILFGRETGADKKVSDGLIYLTQKTLGEPKQVDLISDEFMSVMEKRSSPFPFTCAEEASVVRFEKYTVLIAAGNNE